MRVTVCVFGAQEAVYNMNTEFDVCGVCVCVFELAFT